MTLVSLGARRALACTLLLFALAGVDGFSLAQETSALESMLGSERFRAAGLHKLSEGEQAELVRWLRSNGIGSGTQDLAAAADAGDAAAGEKPSAAEPGSRDDSRDEVVSRLQAPFSGWSGKTVFHLENGQVWRQRRGGRYEHRQDDLPRVRISRNLLGYYEMELLEYGQKTGVSRLR